MSLRGPDQSNCLAELHSHEFRLYSLFMNWIQKTFSLNPRPRGFHLVTQEVLSQIPELRDFNIGWLQLFLQHTSASLTINENADPDVRIDMETAANQLCPETSDFVHTCEGPDDMPAHVKSSLMGCQLMIPIQNGKLNMGIWQGIYLCEHRNRGGSRSIVATIMGEKIES